MSLPSKKAILTASHGNQGTVCRLLFYTFNLTYIFTCHAFFETKRTILQTKQTVISLCSLKQTTMHKDFSYLTRKLNLNSVPGQPRKIRFSYILSFCEDLLWVRKA